jgi:AcrR family transcriptional regulator
VESVYGTDNRPPEDLTTRARIRDAALAQFAERGFNGATMKGVADAAGVSTGLVQHHFGSKEALRRACDDAVIEAFRRRLTTAVEDGELGDPDFMATLHETSAPLLRYVARATVDGTPAAAFVFDQLAAGAEDFLTSTWPDRFEPGSQRAKDAAAVMAAMHSGTIVMHLHLARWLGVDPLDREHSTRIGMSIFDIYTAMGEYVTSETGEQIKAAVAEQQTSQRRTVRKEKRDE